MRRSIPSYDPLREYIESVPLVDTHDHTTVLGPNCTDPMRMVIGDGYFRGDLISASCDKDMAVMENTGLTLEERWPVFERAWKSARHTGYGLMTRRMLRKFYDIEEVTLEALKAIQGRLFNFEDEAAHVKILDEAKIAARIENVFPSDYKAVLDKTWKMTPRARLTIPLPEFHCSFLACFPSLTDAPAVQRVGSAVGRHVTSLDEYLDCCLKIFQGYKDYGAVAFKDQSAYTRPLSFGNPARAEAEKVFNWMMENPTRRPAHPDGLLPLDDYLFHEFMRMARDLDLPVQIHTGHLSDLRYDVSKANAILLTSMLQLHRDVRFDLIHANWPYSGELLFLAKSSPNVSIDFAWTHIIDPIYCRNVLKQAISCVPYGKILGYGSDFPGRPDLAWAHASIARDNIAIALADLVEMEYLGLDEAKEIAYGLLFENANRFFRLGL
jgi:uncharacterized protein